MGCLVLAACGQSDKARDFISSGKAYLEQGRAAEAIIEFKNAAQQQDDNAEVRYLLGIALRRSGELQAAEIELRKADSMGIEPDRIRPELASLMIDMGQTSRARRELHTDGLSSPEAKAEVLARLGDANVGEGEADDARQAYEAALALDARNEAAQLGIARLALLESDIAKARSVVDNVLRGKPDSFHAQLLLAGLLHQEGKIPEAVKAYDQAIELRPVDVRAYVAVVPVLLAQNDIQSGQQRLDRLRKSSPRGLAVPYLDALVAYSQGDRPRARESIGQVVRAAPDDMRALVLAGSVEYDLGNDLLAEKYLAKVVSARPAEDQPRRVLSAVYMRLRQPAKARDTLAPALSSGRADASTWLLAAEIATALGDQRTALSHLEKAAATAPRQAGYLVRLGQSRMRAGDAERGIRDLQAAIEADPQSFDADNILIGHFLSRKQVDRARVVADSMLRRLPQSPASHNAMGQVQIASGDLAAARSSLARALELKPQYMPAVHGLAMLDMRDGKLDAAKGRYLAVLEKVPDDEDAAIAATALLERQGDQDADVLRILDKVLGAKPTANRARLAKIEYLGRTGRFKEAVAMAQQGLEVASMDPSMLLALARSQLAARDSAQAAASFAKLVPLMPGSPVPYLGQADAFAQAKDWLSARASVEKALELQPESVSVRVTLVETDIQAGRLAQARLEAQEIQRRWPKLAVGYAVASRIEVLEKKPEAAEKILRTGMTTADEAGSLVARLVVLMAEGGRAAESDAESERWLAKHPKDVQVMAAMAESNLRRSDFKASERWYRRASSIDPENAVVLNNWAWSLGKLNDTKAALEVGERALKRAPRSPAVLDTVGWLNVESGDVAKGIALLDQAVKLAPQAASVRLNLARALGRAGRKDEAKTQLEALSTLPGADALAKDMEEFRRSL